MSIQLPPKNENDLTSEEKTLLKAIMTDKYSAGAFAGMITNLSLSGNHVSPEWVLKKALEVRLLIKRLIT